MEAHDIVKELIHLILPNYETSHAKTVVKKILLSILVCTSVTAIVNEIINNLPVELNNDQKRSVEEISQKLLDIQEPKVNSFIKKLKY